MSKQMSFQDLFAAGQEVKKNGSSIRILNWNIRNPSIRRAKLQATWILEANADVVILTEAKYSEGCVFLRDYLESHGFRVVLPNPKDKDYCVLVGARGLDVRTLEHNLGFLPHRTISVRCKALSGDINITGLYVPSRGPLERRNIDKREFQDQFSAFLGILTQSAKATNIIAGDLNVVERTHIPHYSVFGEWEYRFYESFSKHSLVDAYRLLYPDALEYSWFGRQGDGYRFDHFFVSDSMSDDVVKCSYIHSARVSGLSDHSAMWLEMESKHKCAPPD
jgi:exodeoxyribonuclease-3